MTTYVQSTVPETKSKLSRAHAGGQLTGQQDFCVSCIKVMSTNMILYDVLAQSKDDLTPEYYKVYTAGS